MIVAFTVNGRMHRYVSYAKGKFPPMLGYADARPAADTICRRVKFSADKVVISGPGFGEVLTIDTFCEFISNRMHSQLKLAASNEGLVVNGPCSIS